MEYSLAQCPIRRYFIIEKLIIVLFFGYIHHFKYLIDIPMVTSHALGYFQ